MPDSLTLRVNGREVTVPRGSMVSAAVALSGAAAFRRSVTGEPRGPLCGMGICFECRVTIDGREHVRSCQEPCRAGMNVEVGQADSAQNVSASTNGAAQSRYDIVVVGAGPAGLAATRCARETGASVALLDDNPAPGGQIWRAMVSNSAEALISSRVVAAPAPGHLTIETASGTLDLAYRCLILATGARERFLPFPGWTLPTVMGAGGLQALAKSGLPIAGKNVIVAGSGPLLLAVAKYLRDHGAHVRLIAEQASHPAVIGFALRLAAHPQKLAQAIQLRASLAITRHLTSCWPVRAEGRERLEAVTLRRRDLTWTEPCDYLACGFGLMPNTELAALLGCRLAGGAVAIDEMQQTSVAGIYAAGEATGIGGLELSVVEGEIAGYAAAGSLAAARARFSARQTHRHFAALLDRAFALREGLRHLAGDDTLVCRCEDVTLGRVRACTGWREAKLHTRCGMGPCQGRVCGGALEFLQGWHADSTRPPVFPARLNTLTGDRRNVSR